MEKYENIIKEFKDLMIRCLDSFNNIPSAKDSFRDLGITTESILCIDSFESLERYMQKMYIVESNNIDEIHKTILIDPEDFNNYIGKEVEIALNKKRISYERLNLILLSNQIYKTANNKKSIFYKTVYDITK